MYGQNYVVIQNFMNVLLKKITSTENFNNDVAYNRENETPLRLPEYKPETKILYKILEDYYTRLKTLYPELNELINDRGEISIEKFSDISKDFSKTQIENHQKKLQKFQAEQALVNMDSKWNDDKYATVKSDEDKIAVHKREQENQKHFQFELLTTILLQKFLGSKYLVVRTSSYDDLVNGIDTVIIHIPSGKVVCALDEVHDGSLEAKYITNKQDKCAKKMNKGGTTLDYGLTTTENSIHHEQEKQSDRKFVPKKYSNVPIFFIGIIQHDFERVLNETLSNKNETLTNIEKSFVCGVFESLKQQLQTYLQNNTYKKSLQTNLQEMERTFNEIFKLTKIA